MSGRRVTPRADAALWWVLCSLPGLTIAVFIGISIADDWRVSW